MSKQAFKYRIYPTKKQEELLFWTLARCRELYNAALSERRDAYKYEHKSITYRMQADDLPEIKGIISNGVEAPASMHGVLHSCLASHRKPYAHRTR